MLRLVLLPRREVPRLQAEHEDSEEKGVYRVMEMLCFGFLIGALTSIIFVAIGIGFGRGSVEKENDNDKRDNSNIDRNSEVLLHGRSDNVSDVPLRNRNRDSDKRNDESMAEKAIMVLQNFRVGACGFETGVIDWMIEQFEEDEENPLGFNPYQE